MFSSTAGTAAAGLAGLLADGDMTDMPAALVFTSSYLARLMALSGC